MLSNGDTGKMTKSARRSVRPSSSSYCDKSHVYAWRKNTSKRVMAAKQSISRKLAKGVGRNLKQKTRAPAVVPKSVQNTTDSPWPPYNPKKGRSKDGCGFYKEPKYAMRDVRYSAKEGCYVHYYKYNSLLHVAKYTGAHTFLEKVFYYGICSAMSSKTSGRLENATSLYARRGLEGGGGKGNRFGMARGAALHKEIESWTEYEAAVTASTSSRYSPHTAALVEYVVLNKGWVPVASEIVVSSPLGSSASQASSLLSCGPKQKKDTRWRCATAIDLLVAEFPADKGDGKKKAVLWVLELKTGSSADFYQKPAVSKGRKGKFKLLKNVPRSRVNQAHLQARVGACLLEKNGKRGLATHAKKNKSCKGDPVYKYVQENLNAFTVKCGVLLLASKHGQPEVRFHETPRWAAAVDRFLQ